MEKTAIRYHEPGGIIWKVLTDETGNFLVIESRDAERRRTLVSVLSIKEDRFVVKAVPAPLPWWIGLKAVVGDTIIFQGYKESQTPEPMGVYALELLTAKLSWKEEEKIFYTQSSRDSIVLASREEEKNVFYKTTLSNGMQQVIEEEAISSYETSETSSGFPLLYTEENIHYKTISEFIHQNGYQNNGPIEYLEYADKLLVSFYIQEGKKWINLFQMIDEEGMILLEERLTEGTDGVGMASFFICGNTLIYIKNKTSIALVTP